METATLEAIHNDLKFIKSEISEIKEHMVDIDSIMTEDDYKALEKYKKEKAKGELTSHEELKRELKL